MSPTYITFCILATAAIAFTAGYLAGASAPRDDSDDDIPPPEV